MMRFITLDAGREPPGPERDLRGSGTFVAVRGDGGIYTSPAGLSGSWTQRISGATKPISSITHGNGRFLAVAGDVFMETETILASPDGVTWTRSYLPQSRYHHCSFGNNLFVILGTFNSVNTVLYGNDGASWTGDSLYVLDRLTSVIWSTIGGGAYYVTQYK